MSLARRYIDTIFIYNLPRLNTMNINRFNEKNSLTLKKASRRQYSTETMMDADYTNDLALASNIPAQAKPLMHSMKQAARDIGFYVNPNKTEFLCFKENGAFATLYGKPLKLVYYLMYSKGTGCYLLAIEIWSLR